MIKIQILALSLLFVSFVQSAQVLTYTCQSVTTSVCASGFRWRTQGSYEGNTLDSYYCVPQGKKCTPTVSQFNLQTCKVDYKNNACSTGVCFMVPQKQVLTTVETCGTSAAPKTYNVNYKCDTCSPASSCAKCFYKTTNETGTSAETQTCLGANCTQGLSTATTVISQCTGGFDGLGQQGSCCVRTEQVSRFCTSNSEALSRAEVTTWFNKVQNNNQSKIQIFLSLAILLIIVMLN